MTGMESGKFMASLAEFPPLQKTQGWGGQQQ
jgi:hypothetical protein